MDIQRKKQLLEEYRNRRPQMGVLSFYCKATEETFLLASKDIQADQNGVRFKLSANGHPNKRLQALWNQHGEDNFEISAIRVLKYENPNEDHTKALEKLLAECFEINPGAMLIWKGSRIK